MRTMAQWLEKLNDQATSYETALDEEGLLPEELQERLAEMQVYAQGAIATALYNLAGEVASR